MDVCVYKEIYIYINIYSLTMRLVQSNQFQYDAIYWLIPPLIYRPEIGRHHFLSRNGCFVTESDDCLSNICAAYRNSRIETSFKNIGSLNLFGNQYCLVEPCQNSVCTVAHESGLPDPLGRGRRRSTGNVNTVEDLLKRYIIGWRFRKTNFRSCVVFPEGACVGVLRRNF